MLRGYCARKCGLYALTEQFVWGVEFSLDNCSTPTGAQFIGKQKGIVLYLLNTQQKKYRYILHAYLRRSLTVNCEHIEIGKRIYSISKRFSYAVREHFIPISSEHFF